MCRLLAIVSDEPVDYRLLLCEAPKSLAALSREHPHGWGIAIFDDTAGWTVEKHPACALDDTRFHQKAVGCRGEVLVAHIRQRTVGTSCYANTHPFEKNGWVFAHNGTIHDTDFLRANVSAERLAEMVGETDSELFFAYLLSRLDAQALTALAPQAETDAAITAAVEFVQQRSTFGAVNFLLCNGQVLYGHRLGRTMFLMTRDKSDAVRTERRSEETGTIIETPWSSACRAVIIASEQMTNEPWTEVQERALFRLDRDTMEIRPLLGG